MTPDEVAAYCLGKPGAEETYPFGDDTLVAKVGGKAFAFVGLAEPVVGVKCGRDREDAAEPRARHPHAVTPMRYLARYGWNSLATDRIPADETRDLIDASYDDVVARLPRSRRP